MTRLLVLAECGEEDPMGSEQVITAHREDETDHLAEIDGFQIQEIKGKLEEIEDP